MRTHLATGIPRGSARTEKVNTCNTWSGDHPVPVQYRCSEAKTSVAWHTADLKTISAQLMSSSAGQVRSAEDVTQPKRCVRAHRKQSHP